MIDSGIEDGDPPRRDGSVLAGYLSPKGRLSRGDFLVRVAAPCVVGVLVLSTLLEARSVAGLLFMSFLYWVYLAGLAKRLQDFGLPGLPIAGVAVAALWLQIETTVALPGWLQTYVYAFFVLALLFAASTPSEAGANPYGP